MVATGPLPLNHLGCLPKFCHALRMPWNPVILRKYSTTGHFRLLNQLRGELRDNPMPRPQKQRDEADEGNQGRSPIRSLDVRSRAGSGFRSRRPLQSAGPAAAPIASAADADQNSGSTFRERLSAIDMR